MSLAFALALCSIQRTASRPELGELEHATASARITFVGRVTLPHGRPACGANVVTSAGGEARTDADGEFELVADVPCDARWVDVIASVGDGDREDLTSSAHILPAALSGTTSVGTLVMAPGTVGGRWLPSFGGLPGVSGNVLAMTVFDEGAGPALYSGGSFTSAGGLEVQNIARWDGTRWSALGDGLSGGGFEPVQALVVFDDGTGAALYAGGAFQSSGTTQVSRVARWDGASWSSLGSGLDGTVRALAVFDDGSGAALYATGTFTTAGGTFYASPARDSFLAKWSVVRRTVRTP